MIVAHAGGLAGAVAAEQAEQAAGLQREADAVQHMAVAVERRRRR